VTNPKLPTGQTRHLVFLAVRDFIRRNGHAPTIRQIGDLVGISSVSTVHYHLTALREAGRIDWAGGGANRTLRVVGQESPQRRADAAERVVEELTKEVSRLSEALATYGGHLLDCAVRSSLEAVACTCGFSAVLRSPSVAAAPAVRQDGVAGAT
jgi:hypothetical protein